MGKELEEEFQRATRCSFPFENLQGTRSQTSFDVTLCFHRMVEIGRNFWRSSSPNPCSIRNTQSRFSRSMSKQFLRTSKEISTASLGNSWQSPTQVNTYTVKICFLMFRWKLLCFTLCPLPLGLTLGTILKSLVPSSLHSPFRYLYILISFLLNLYFTG